MKTLSTLVLLPGLAATLLDLMAQKPGNGPPQSQ